MSHSSCVTVTQGSVNAFPLSQSGNLLLAPYFEPFLTHFHNCVIWTARHFLIISCPFFNWNCPTHLEYLLHKVPVVFSFTPSEQSSLMLSFESLLTRFHTYFLWTATHVFVVYLSFIFLVELFHSSCVTVKQGPRKSSCLIPSRQSILLFLFKLLMTHSHQLLYCLDCYTFLTHFLNEILPFSFVYL